MMRACREGLSHGLQRPAFFDPGVEAARNACAADASLASAAIAAAAYYDNPLTGSRALVACLGTLCELSSDARPQATLPERFIAAFERARDGEQPPPGFGHITPARALAVRELARELTAACECAPAPRWLAVYLEHGGALGETLGPLNPAGLAALVLHDHGVAADEAEALYLTCRIEAAVGEARKARAAGLSRFPFSAYRYVYEGERPPPRHFDWPLLVERCGLTDECADEDRVLKVDGAPAAPPVASDGAAPELRASSGVVDIGRQVIVHGKDVHHDCRRMSFVQYFLFSATGRDFGAAVARVFEQLWIISGYADARIWCNRVAGFMGSARVDPALSTSAALAACNNERYGFRAMATAFAFQSAVPEPLAARNEWLAEALRAGTPPPGYARPVAGPDERIAAGLQILADAGLRAGPALRRAFWVRQRTKAALGVDMHVTALWAAVALDLGFTAREYDAFMQLVFTPGFVAVHADQLARPPLSFLREQQTLL